MLKYLYSIQKVFENYLYRFFNLSYSKVEEEFEVKRDKISS